MNEKITFAPGVNPKSASLSATVIRADGTREDLGVIAYYNRNPLKMLWWNLTRYYIGVQKWLKQNIQ